MCATKDDGYLEKFYQLVGMSSCNNILQSHVGTLASSISRAFSNLFQPFKSHGDDEQSNGGTIFYCIDYEELIPLYTGSVVVLIWVIIFKVYIDSLNEVIYQSNSNTNYSSRSQLLAAGHSCAKCFHYRPSNRQSVGKTDRCRVYTYTKQCVCLYASEGSGTVRWRI